MKKIKQINNLVIKEDNAPEMVYFGTRQKNPPFGTYSVHAPNGICLEDRMTLEEAKEFCRNTKDFVERR